MQNKLLKNYFLGLLDSNDLKRVDLQILEDDSFEENLVEAENNLIEDYLENNLTNEEIIAFNKNFLVTRERLRRVEFIRYLKDYALSRPHNEIKPSFFEQLKGLFSQPKLALMFSLIILIFMLGIGFLIFQNPQNNIESEIVNLNKKDLSDLGEYGNLKTLNLISENFRSTEKSAFLPQQELTDKVMLRLLLPAPIKSEQTFSVSISQNGQSLPLFTQHSYQNQEIRILLPKSILKQGEYRITLTKSSEKYNYYFVIQ